MPGGNLSQEHNDKHIFCKPEPSGVWPSGFRNQKVCGAVHSVACLASAFTTATGIAYNKINGILHSYLIYCFVYKPCLIHHHYAAIFYICSLIVCLFVVLSALIKELSYSKKR